MENGTVKKDDGTGIHVNPLFNGGNSNKSPGSLASSTLGNPIGSEAVSSLPSTPCRSRTLSEPRTGTPRRGRANSTGNVSRSHERQHSQGMPDYPDQSTASSSPQRWKCVSSPSTRYAVRSWSRVTRSVPSTDSTPPEGSDRKCSI